MPSQMYFLPPVSQLRSSPVRVLRFHYYRPSLPAPSGWCISKSHFRVCILRSHPVPTDVGWVPRETDSKTLRFAYRKFIERCSCNNTRKRWEKLFWAQALVKQWCNCKRDSSSLSYQELWRWDAHWSCPHRSQKGLCLLLLLLLFIFIFY